jgi:hypothetical protein
MTNHRPRGRRSRQAERNEDARKLEAAIDEALMETFPASDPPWFMAASGVVGFPRNDPS